MTKYEVKRTSRFKRDYKTIKKRGYDIQLLAEPIEQLADVLTLTLDKK